MTATSGKKAGIRALRVSAADVARHVGVSRATVSYVMNGRPGVSHEMRERVLAAAEELGHTSSTRAAQLRSQRTRVIGLVLTDIANPFYTEIAAGVIDAAREQGYEVFVAHTQESPDVLACVVDAMIARGVDGIVLTVLHPEDGEVIRALRKAHVPFVQLSRRIPQLDADWVGLDDHHAAITVMDHVLDHEYQQIATIVGPRSSSASAARELGFAAAARARGIEIPPRRRISTYLSEDGGRRAVERLLADGPLPDALVCGSDAIAVGVLEVLRVQGIQAGVDVAVTGFDGLYPGVSLLSIITTINQPRRQMARTAFDLLVRRIEGFGGAPQIITCPHFLRIGTTCGCPDTSMAPNGLDPAISQH